MIFVFFAANKWFEKTDKYFIACHNVSASGLEVGSPAEYLGIRNPIIKLVFLKTLDEELWIYSIWIFPATSKMQQKSPIVEAMFFVIGLVLALQSATQLRSFGASIIIVDPPLQSNLRP